jgi:hypothetical protein
MIEVIEMSLSSWLVAGIVPGVERPPLKKPAVKCVIPNGEKWDAIRGALVLFCSSGAAWLRV